MVVVEVLRGAVDGSGDGSGSGDGYGDGSGYGSGSGSGSGYGYGSGDGSGDGSGYGYGSGDGSGDGDGYGYGSGDGYGDGSGYGYGSGYGSGDGSGDGDYWLAAMPYLTNGWTDEQRGKLTSLIAAHERLAFWRSGSDGQPSNGGGRLAVAAPGVIHTAKGPLNLCHAGTLHATSIPPKWKGARVWIVVLHGEVVGTEEKWGCLKREIIGECAFS